MNDEDERKAEAFADAALEGGIIEVDKITHPSQSTEVKDAEQARLEDLRSELLDRLSFIQGRDSIPERIKEDLETVIKAISGKIRRIQEGDIMLFWMHDATLQQLRDHCKNEPARPAFMPTLVEVQGMAAFYFMGWAVWTDNWIEPGQIELSAALTKFREQKEFRTDSLMAAAAKFDELMRRDL